MNLMTNMQDRAVAPDQDRVARRGGDTQSVRVVTYLVMALLDVLGLCAGFGIAGRLYNGNLVSVLDLHFYWTLIPVFLLVSFYQRLYSFRTMMSLPSALARLTLVMAITLALDVLLVFISKDADGISRVGFFLGLTIAYGILALIRSGAVAFVRDVLGDRFMRRVLIIDDCQTYVPAGFDVIDAQAAAIVPDTTNPFMLHRFSNLVVGADRVVVSCQPHARENWSMYLRVVGCSGELLVPELHVISPVHSEVDTGWIGIRVSAGPLDLRNRLLKRTLDLAVTIPAILLLSPLLVLVAVAVKLDSAGPALFRQRRMGRGNRLFDVFKFRSMASQQVDSDGNQSARRDDLRVTRVGRLIRSTSIDELPQLFNVLIGDMSLVGPRPHALGSLAGNQLFWDIDGRYWLRHAIKPGITGLAQVRGHRGATDHQSDLTDRLQSDLEYVGNWTILKDLAILARTATVLVHKNAY